MKTSQNVSLQLMTVHGNLVQSHGWAIYVSMKQALVVNNIKMKYETSLSNYKAIHTCLFYYQSVINLLLLIRRGPL